MFRSLYYWNILAFSELERARGKSICFMQKLFSNDTRLILLDCVTNRCGGGWRAERAVKPGKTSALVGTY